MADTAMHDPLGANNTHDPDSDSEWEYEYSTTETETHLITLDLSVPEFVRQRDDIVVHNTRGGFRSWQNPLNIEDARPFKGFVDSEGEGEGDDGDGNNAQGVNNQMDSHKAKTVFPSKAQAPKADPPPPQEEPDATEIQVMELHSAAPIVAYRGMLFQGAWSETIGTEMVFAKSAEGTAEDRRVLHVSDDVDLIGATSARITFSPIEMMPKKEKVSSTAPAVETTAKTGPKKGLGFVIPVSNNASVQRQQQASFLEQLMALKHHRGEPDVVTVQAMETKQNAVHGDIQEQKRRARRETQLQVHQERRAKRLREALNQAAEGAGDGNDTAMMESPQPQTQAQTQTQTKTPSTQSLVRRRRNAARGGRARISDLSQVARVAGDDNLLAISTTTGPAGAIQGGEGNNDEGDDDDQSLSEEDDEDGE